jgi:hypothetical protein
MEFLTGENLTVLKTILPSLGSVFGVLLTGAIGIATYSWQENAKRQTELVARRQKLYEDLNGALFGLILAKTSEDRRRILADIEKGWLFASDEVLAALFKYMDCFDRYWVQVDGDVQSLIREDAAARQEIERAMAAIFLAMRRDLRSTNISEDLAQNYLHFYRCGMLAP